MPDIYDIGFLVSSLSTTVRDTSQAASGLDSSWMGDRYGSVVLSEPRTISSGGRVERTLAFLALDVEMWKSDIQRQAMSKKSGQVSYRYLGYQSLSALCGWQHNCP